MKMQPPVGGMDGPVQPALGMEELISFRIEASLGDSDITEDELNALVEAGVPLCASGENGLKWTPRKCVRS